MVGRQLILVWEGYLFWIQLCNFNVFSFLSIFPPVSLLLFSVFFNQSNDVLIQKNLDPKSDFLNQSNDVLIQKNEGLNSDSFPIKNLTIGEWMLNYLIVSIPLIGFIFLIIWATDKNNVIRKLKGELRC